MTSAMPQTRRGRPPAITRERILDAGIAMGLPRLTFIGVAARLGVSHMALYKHVASLEALKLLVAEEIFFRWTMPDFTGQTAETYLVAFSASLRALVGRNPGLAFYMIRRQERMPGMIAQIQAHHYEMARSFGISRERAGWLLSTVAFHCIALADTVYSAAYPDQNLASHAREEAPRYEAEFARGMHALIVGLLGQP